MEIPSKIRHQERHRQKRINETESEVVETIEVEDTDGNEHYVLKILTNIQHQEKHIRIIKIQKKQISRMTHIIL